MQLYTGLRGSKLDGTRCNEPSPNRALSSTFESAAAVLLEKPLLFGATAIILLPARTSGSELRGLGFEQSPRRESRQASSSPSSFRLFVACITRLVHDRTTDPPQSMPPLQYGEAKNANDASADDGFCAIIRKLPPTPAGTVRLFDRGEFFSAFGPDAYYVATHHYKASNALSTSHSASSSSLTASRPLQTQTVIKKLGKITSSNPDGLPAVTLSPAVAQSFLRDALTTKQLRIELYESEGGKNSAKWRLGKSASPGNLGSVEELLFAHTDMLAAPVILALKLSVKENIKTVGVAFADTSRQDMGVSEFVDNDLFSNTEVSSRQRRASQRFRASEWGVLTCIISLATQALLIQLGVKEVLLPADEKNADYDLRKIRTLVERCNIVITDRKRSEPEATRRQSSTATDRFTLSNRRVHGEGRRAGPQSTSSRRLAGFYAS